MMYILFQNAGQVLQEIAKDRPSQKAVDQLTQQVMGSIKSVDGKLSDQVKLTTANFHWNGEFHKHIAVVI